MDTEAGIWLLALLIAVSFSAVRLRLQGLRWRWGRGWWAHLAAAASLAIFGLLAAPSSREAALALAVLGWALLLLPGFGTLAVMSRLRLAIATYDLAGARRWVAWMRPLGHLPAAGLARAQVSALERALAGDHAGAEAPLLAYDAPDTPPTLRRAAQAIRLFVRLHARDWAGIVLLAEAIAPPGPVGLELAGPAARACLELGDAAGATGWLARMQVDEVADVGAVDRLAIPIFALLGARDDLEAAFGRLGPQAMPGYLRAYWHGRARAALGDLTGAREAFTRALETLPPALGEAQRRIADALAALDAPQAPLAPEVRDRALAVARAAIAPARGAAELVRGARASTAPRLLGVLVAVPSLVVLAGLERWVPGWWEQAVWAFEAGALDTDAVRAGEGWRLLTHMGLHAHLTHLALNLFALLWLGSRATRLYGPVALVAAFFAGGLAGGLVHVAFSPQHHAVGASGGILALLGMLAVGWFRARDLLPAPLRRRLLWELIAVICIQLVFDQFVPHVAAAAHAGGLLAGALIGALVPLRARREAAQRSAGGSSV